MPCKRFEVWDNKTKKWPVGRKPTVAGIVLTVVLVVAGIVVTAIVDML